MGTSVLLTADDLGIFATPVPFSRVREWAECFPLLSRNASPASLDISAGTGRCGTARPWSAAHGVFAFLLHLSWVLKSWSHCIRISLVTTQRPAATLSLPTRPTNHRVPTAKDPDNRSHLTTSWRAELQTITPIRPYRSRYDSSLADSVQSDFS